MAKKINRLDLRIIHENDFGYIGQCHCCGEIQFCLGNVFSFMAEAEFLRLHSSLKKINNRFESCLFDMPNGEKIIIRTPAENFLLSLSRSDFYKMMDLFDNMEANVKLIRWLEKPENLN